MNSFDVLNKQIFIVNQLLTIIDTHGNILAPYYDLASNLTYSDQELYDILPRIQKEGGKLK